jgi:hypothetical protein
MVRLMFSTVYVVWIALPWQVPMESLCRANYVEWLPVTIDMVGLGLRIAFLHKDG